MIRIDQPRLQVLFGDDLPDVAQFLKSETRRWPKSVWYSIMGKNDFTGCGYNEALRLASEGYTAGALDFDAAVKAIPVHAKEASVGYDISGAFPDVGRFVSGDPLHMMSRGRKPKRPVVHLVVNIVCSGVTKKSAIRDYGIAMTSIVDRLENAGRRVELDVLFCSSLRGSIVAGGWKVKRADDSLDLGAVAFALSHPAALRRLCFALFEFTDPKLATFTYGECAPISDKVLRAIGADGAFAIEGIGTSYFGGARDMRALAAKQINDAAGETLVELEQ